MLNLRIVEFPFVAERGHKVPLKGLMIFPGFGLYRPVAELRGSVAFSGRAFVQVIHQYGKSEIGGAAASIAPTEPARTVIRNVAELALPDPAPSLVGNHFYRTDDVFVRSPAGIDF